MDANEQARAKRIGAQHAEIRDLLQELQHGSRSSDASPRIDEKTLDVLERLETLLGDHFALEERGGYMAEELVIAPQFAGAVTRLQNEHRSLRDEIHSIRERARDASAPEQSEKALVEAVGDFAKRLDEHETEENHLIQATYLEDRGGG